MINTAVLFNGGVRKRARKILNDSGGRGIS